MDSQRPEGLEKIRQLEEATHAGRTEISEAATRQRPVFTQPLQNIDAIAEGATAHFECRLIPVGDPTLKVEWFRNEKQLEDSEYFYYIQDTLSQVNFECFTDLANYIFTNYYPNQVIQQLPLSCRK